MKPWYEADEGIVHRSLIQTVAKLKKETSNQARESTYLQAIRYYSNLETIGDSMGHFSFFYGFRSSNKRPSRNVVKRSIETIKSKLLQNKPRPMFLTSKGDFELREKAKRTNKWLEGKFQSEEIDQQCKRWVLDALLFGDGVLKVHEVDGDATVSRVFAGDLLVAPTDGYDGKPNSIYQISVYPKRYLASVYPEFADKIKVASCGIPNYFERMDRDEYCMVYEAWDLPIGDESGRHVVCTSNCDLEDEEWEETTFPFVFLRYCQPVFGFWGSGAAEQLFGHQDEINTLSTSIQLGHKLIARPRTWVQAGSVTTQQLSNSIGEIAVYKGSPPIFQTPVAFTAETYNYLARKTQDGFEELGISPYTAQGEKPSGLNSGRAQLVAIDNQSTVFVDFQRDYEQGFINIGKQLVKLAKRISEENPDYEVVFRGKNHIERIAWKDVDLSEGEYVLSVFPVSQLPTTPQGKLSALQEMLNAGLIDRDTWLRLSEFPDLDAELALQTAPRELIDDMVYEMLVNGREFTVEPFFRLDLCVLIGGLSYMRAKIDQVPEENLAILREFIKQAQDLIAESQPPPQAMPETPQPPMPEGTPMLCQT